MMSVRLVLLLAAALATACGDSDSTTCGGTLTCDDFAAEPDFAAGSMDAVPDGFPAAPAGAELCGQADGPTIYFVSDRTDIVHDHYQDALSADGWTTIGPISPAGPADGGPDCETEQGFTMGDPLILVHVYPSRGAFSLGLRNFEQ